MRQKLKIVTGIVKINSYIVARLVTPVYFYGKEATNDES